MTLQGYRHQEIIDGRGVDRIIKVVGLATINRSLRAVANGG